MDRLFPEAPSLERFEFLEPAPPAHGTHAWRARDRHAGTEVHLETLPPTPRFESADDVRARFAPPESEDPTPYARIVATGIAESVAWIAWEFTGSPAVPTLGTALESPPLSREVTWAIVDTAARAAQHAHEQRALYSVLHAPALRFSGKDRVAYVFSSAPTSASADPYEDLFFLAHAAFALLVGHAHPGSFPKGLLPLALTRPGALGSPEDPPSVVAALLHRSDALPDGFDTWFSRCTLRDRTYFSVREAREALRYILAPWAPPVVPTASRAELAGPMMVMYGAPPAPAYGSPAAPLIAGTLGLAAAAAILYLILRACR